MKTKEEILFDKMQPGEDGKFKSLTDVEILQAMQDYAEEALRCYIMERTRCNSNFEALRTALMFFESELF